jgi:hypothetical protein
VVLTRTFVTHIAHQVAHTPRPACSVMVRFIVLSFAGFPWRCSVRFEAETSALTRRRYPERPDCWHVFFDDLNVGTIAIQAGVPFEALRWGWTGGFYPASHRGVAMSERHPSTKPRRP